MHWYKHAFIRYGKNAIQMSISILYYVRMTTMTMMSMIIIIYSCYYNIHLNLVMILRRQHLQTRLCVICSEILVFWCGANVFSIFSVLYYIYTCTSTHLYNASMFCSFKYNSYIHVYVLHQVLPHTFKLQSFYIIV